MSEITLNGITKRYGDGFEAVPDLDLEIRSVPTDSEPNESAETAAAEGA